MSKRTLTVLALSGGLVLAAGLAAAHVVGQHGGWHGRHFAQMGMMGGHHGRMGMMGRGIGGGGAQGLCEGAGREGWKAMRDGIKAGGATFDQTMAARNDCFAKLDSNKDGALDAAEVTAALSAAGSGMDQRMIAMMDVNGDGKLSKDEFLFMAKRRAAMMQRMQGAAPDAGSATAGDAGTAGDSGGMTADSGTAGTTMRPRSPITTRCVPLMSQVYHRVLHSGIYAAQSHTPWRGFSIILPCFSAVPSSGKRQTPGYSKTSRWKDSSTYSPFGSTKTRSSPSIPLPLRPTSDIDLVLMSYTSSREKRTSVSKALPMNDIEISSR